jgi:hypothetical protein
MEVTTGTIGEGRSQWTYEVTVEFVQVPDDKRDAYWATLAWLADEILKELSAESGRATPRSVERETEAMVSEEILDPSF